MATRFVRIDLSDEARDFRPIAIEPGVPMLDRSNAVAKVLFRWLGGLVAEPVWDGDSVNFYVRDDIGGRLEEVACQPISPGDLQSLLKEDLDALSNRIENAKPETSTERAVRKILLQSFRDLTDRPGRTDLDCYFYKYKDVQGRWRLVWCWGYQRVDQIPAPATVCGDAKCGLLFVRRPGKSAKCPGCAKAIAPKPVRRANWRRRLVAALLLLLAVGAVVYWYTHPLRLIATPVEVAGPVGGRVGFKIIKAGLFRKQDVTRQVVGIVLDPAVARFDPKTATAALVSTGTTTIRFRLGDLAANVGITSGLATNPDSLAIEPANVELAVGTTARLRLIGRYKDGAEIDLTGAGEWLPQNDGTVYAYNGLLEGLAEGTSTVNARYRANPQSEFVKATSAVNVAKASFQVLESQVDPGSVGLGRASDLRIEAITEDGKRYSVVESSMLKTTVEPRYLATVQGGSLQGEQLGQGQFTAAFGDGLIAAPVDFEVAPVPGVDKLIVAPEELSLVAGQIADLSVASPMPGPIRVVSSDPSVVEVTPANRLVGRREGSAQVEVMQGAERSTVNVKVAPAAFRSIALDPTLLAVPVDDAIRPRVMAEVEGDSLGRSVEIAPDLVECLKRPSPRYAQFETPSMELRGVKPTEPSSPQSLAMGFQGLKASGPVEVVVAPLRLELTPAGPVELPLGQQMRLQGWAHYSGGRRVQVPAERMKWRSEKQKDAAPGLELRGDRVAALNSGGGPLPVWASYFSRESNRVVFKSVEAGPVTLRANVDRTLRLAGETGRVLLSGTDPHGDVELVPEMATFQSADAKVLKIDEKSGAFRAAAPGESIVTASHAASKQPATVKLSVYDPSKVRMVFDPATVKVAVDEVARLPLYLEVKDAGKVERALLEGPGVGYALGRPEAVRWQPPTVVGVSPAPPFELSASFSPHLTSTATAQVEVTPATPPAAIRIVPSDVSLAPGQRLSLKVEQQMADSPDQWKEVRPDSVAWKPAPRLLWTPATEGLRPSVGVAQGATGEFEVQATYAGKEASALVTVKTQGPDPNDPNARVLVVREPGSEYLPVGKQQRYSIVVEKDGVQEPVADIRWPDDFENEYVAWKAPVLAAKKAGYQQSFRAEAGGRTVLFHTTTYEPGRFEQGQPVAPGAQVVAMARGDKPVAVKILSDQGQTVSFPVGAEFHDFRVEAHYADGFTRVVTKKALLTTPEPPDSALLSASNGLLVGVRPGQTNVHAAFDGVRSEQPLGTIVTAGLDVDRITLSPSPATILPGQTLTMDAIGHKNGRSVGIIGRMAQMTWQAGDEKVARASGAAVTGLAEGQTTVTAKLGSITSEPAQVIVAGSIAAPLRIDPGRVQMRVGESLRIGSDLSALCGAVDLSRDCRVTSSLPAVVRYVPETHSLMAVSPGSSAVGFTWRDKLANTMVDVLPAGLVDGQVVIEPSSGTLAPGQAMDLRVYVIGRDGSRIDRTESAVLTSSDQAKISMRGNKACAVAPGASKVMAALPGISTPASAYLVVNDEPIEDLVVEPSSVAMSVGDRARLRVLGKARCGTHEMFAQPDLTIAAAGANQAAIRVLSNQVEGVSPGQAAVALDWRKTLKREVPVSVNSDQYADLRIEPAEATIHPSEGLTYQVTAMRGGERRVLGPEDGVQLFTTDANVARAIAGTTVGALAAGRTAVVAQFAGQRAEAGLTVTPAGEAVVVAAPGQYSVDAPGFGHYENWVNDPAWRAIVGGDVVVGPGTDVIVPGTGAVVAPQADITGLRFVPDLLRIPTNSPGSAVRVVEVMADGTDGRDVTADPSLELADTRGIVTVEKGAQGPILKPVQTGRTRVAAKLGALTSVSPLGVEVGDMPADAAQLQVVPNPLVLWSGETGSFASVQLLAGPNQLPIDMDYKLSAPAGQGIVAIEGDKSLRGLSIGTTQVTIDAVDPSGAFGKLSATAMVQVTTPDELWVEPRELDMQVGDPTPPLAVMARGADGVAYQVPGATLESLDQTVLSPDPESPGRFTAKSFGQTHVRGVYRGREVLARVTVAGKRFVKVDLKRPEGDQNNFELPIEVLAAQSEGALEYRVYQAGQAAAESWVPSQSQGEFRQTLLRSPRLPYGPRGMQYQLVVEARDPANGSVQRYPLTFRLVEVAEETGVPGGGATPNR